MINQPPYGRNRSQRRLRTYGVIGMELRIREPNAEGVDPSRLGTVEDVVAGEEVKAWRAGVSRTSFLNCELFIVAGNRLR